MLVKSFQARRAVWTAFRYWYRAFVTARSASWDAATLRSWNSAMSRSSAAWSIAPCVSRSSARYWRMREAFSKPQDGAQLARLGRRECATYLNRQPGRKSPCSLSNALDGLEVLPAMHIHQQQRDLPRPRDRVQIVARRVFARLPPEIEFGHTPRRNRADRRRRRYRH